MKPTIFDPSVVIFFDLDETLMDPHRNARQLSPPYSAMQGDTTKQFIRDLKTAKVTMFGLTARRWEHASWTEQRLGEADVDFRDPERHVSGLVHLNLENNVAIVNDIIYTSGSDKGTALQELQDREDLKLVSSQMFASSFKTMVFVDDLPYHVLAVHRFFRGLDKNTYAVNYRWLANYQHPSISFTNYPVIF